MYYDRLINQFQMGFAGFAVGAGLVSKMYTKKQVGFLFKLNNWTSNSPWTKSVFLFVLKMSMWPLVDDYHSIIYLYITFAYFADGNINSERAETDM